MKTYRESQYRTRRYRRHKERRTRARRMISAFTLLLVVGGLGIVGYSLLLGEDALLPRAISVTAESEEVVASAPADTTLKLTVPEMARVEDLPVYDAPWDDEAALDASAAHLDTTGFPWQEGANVYIVGHRMGFPGTRSFLVFYDQDKLENGDEIFLEDSEGTRYTYKVYESFIADPTETWVTEPVPGKSIITLQTCTLPDYVQRIVTRAELVEEA